MTGDAEANPAARMAAAADRTVAMATARLFSAWCEGSPVPQAGDQLWEGVTDFAQRRADVFGGPLPERLVPAGLDDKLAGLADENPDLFAIVQTVNERHRTIYDGARWMSSVDGRWIESVGESRDGPRDRDDPLWPLDTLFGVNDDVVEVAQEPVRETDTVHCRLTVDLLRADERLPAGMSVPEGPLRRLRQIPAEVWLDASGCARRIAVSFASSSARGTRDSWIWRVTELWDFGVTVTVTPPRRDEVHEIDWPTIGRSNR